MINVYRILNVPATATDDEIKRSYHRLSKDYHPDRGGDPQKMAELNEAYSLIDTPEKRKKYDSDNAFGTSFRQWETIFGKSNVAKNFGNAPVGNSKSVRGKDIELTVNISIESFLGGERVMVVKYSKENECLECSGTGIKLKHNCSTCGGTGKLRGITPDLHDTVRKCEACGGTGDVVKEKCPVCSGEGSTTKECTYTFTYPPQTIKMDVPGKGNEGRNGGENGNLKLKFKPTSETIDFHDGEFWTKVAIHPEDFVLGVVVDIDFGGKMVVYKLEGSSGYHDNRKIRKVAGTKYTLNVEFCIEDEPDLIRSEVVDAMIALHDARLAEKD